MSRVYVIGSINMDLVAFSPRHPRVGETVMGQDLHLLPGGKGANQAVAAKRAGADTALVGRVGDDAFAEELREFLEGEEIDLALTTPVQEMTTGAALITVADSDNSIVVIPGANAYLDEATIAHVPIEAGDVVIAQFETPQTATRVAFERARLAGAVTILNPAPAMEPIEGLLDLADFIVLNETELALLGGEQIDADAIGPAEAAELARRLADRSDQIVIATLGAAGAIVYGEGEVFEVAGHEVRAIDTTGAGDCFVGNLGAAIAAGVGMREAVELANRAASICVQTIGAGVSMPTREMLGHAET